MKIIEPSYEILTSIPEKGVYVLKDIEDAARTCYKSEDKATDDGTSAIAMADRLIKNGHEAPIEFCDITIHFICDRGVSHELVRHRLASFCQESTRYCNYSKDKFGNEITVIEPVIFSQLKKEDKNEVYELYENYVFSDCTEDLEYLSEFPDELLNYARWRFSCHQAECSYMEMTQNGCTPEIARSVLPTCLKTEVMMKANLREWRHVLKERTSERAHPEMRRLMLPLLFELHDKIPIVFDDIFEKVQHMAVK